jgi:hypothetical protein
MAVSLGRKRSQAEMSNPRELKIHHAFQGELYTKKGALEALACKEPGSYVLWTKKGTHYLSFVASSGEIHHKVVNKNLSKWSWRNGDPHCKSSLRAIVLEILAHEFSNLGIRLF